MKAFAKFNLGKAIEMEEGCSTTAGPERLSEELLESPAGVAEEKKGSFAGIRRALDALMRQAYLTSSEIAHRLEVSPATVSRWHAGHSQPDARQTKALFSVLRDECVTLFESPLQPSEFEFICSFADHYPPGHDNAAKEVLRRALTDPIILGPPVEGAMELHLHIKTVDLPSGVRAHCFAERSEKLPPRVFVILVDRKLSEAEQYEVAWGEARAHVQSMLRAHCLDCGQPSRIVKGS